MRLDGVFDNTNFDDSRLFQSAFSIELGLYLSEYSEGILFELRDSNILDREIQIAITSDKTVRVYFYTGGEYVWAETSQTLDETNPSHITVTYSDASQTLAIYIDSIKFSKTFFEGIDLAEDTVSQYNFEFVNTSGMSGYITMLRIWNKELPESEIQGLINDYIFNSVTNPELIAAFYFDESQDENYFLNKYDVTTDVCNNSRSCYLEVNDGTEMSADAVNEFTLSGSSDDPNESGINPVTGEPYVNSLPSVISYSSIYKILSCGIGPNNIISGIERFVQYDGFESVNQSIIGERKF